MGLEGSTLSFCSHFDNLGSVPLPQGAEMKFTKGRLVCVKMPDTPSTKSAPGVSQHA